MFQEGKIKNYNADRGFGFIEVDGEKRDVFFHIKDFPNKNIAPKVGENLKFRKVQDGEKFKADNIVRLDIKPSISTSGNVERNTVNRRNRQKKLEGSGFDFFGVLTAFIIVGIFIVIFIPMIKGIYQRGLLANRPAAPTKVTNGNFTCDGRKHCSEMKSYDEAVFFINHCPGTLMDGDDDDEPCENDSRW